MPEVCAERIRKRDRKGESNISLVITFFHKSLKFLPIYVILLSMFKLISLILFRAVFFSSYLITKCPSQIDAIFTSSYVVI